MPRTLSAGILADIAAPVTEPGYFVEILFSPPLRLSTRGDETWNGVAWFDWDVKIGGLGVDGSSSSQTGTLTLGNADLSIGALILSQGVADRGINIWKFYGTAPALADPVQIFGGVGDGGAIDPTAGKCQIQLRPAGGVTVYSPRRYMTAETGWHHLPITGSSITWGRTTITLSADGI